MPADCERIRPFADNSRGGVLSRGRRVGSRYALVVLRTPSGSGPRCRPALTLGRPGGRVYSRVALRHPGPVSLRLGPGGLRDARLRRAVELRATGLCDAGGALLRFRVAWRVEL